MSGNINSNYKDLLKELGRVNTENTISVFIPSVGKSHKFKALTVKQQKELIKSAADPTLMNLQFNIVTNNIIKENSIDDVDFKLHDKVLVLIALRAQTVSSMYSATEPESGETLSIDLLRHLKQVKADNKFDKKTASFTVTIDNIVVECTAPTLQTDTEVSRDCLRSIKNADKSVQIEDITQFTVIETVGDIYAYEIIKYIDTITINPDDDDTRTVVDFSDINTTQKISVLEAMPMSFSQKFISYIAPYKEFDERNVTIEDNSGTYIITIDPSFFATDE
jgi:hypothetical protein